MEKPHGQGLLRGAWLNSSVALEVETQLHRFRSRRHIMRAAERGNEIVQRLFVRQVDDREAQAPLVTVAIEQIVLAHGNVEHVPRSDALRIVVVVLRSGRRNRYILGTIVWRRAEVRAERRTDRRSGGRKYVSAEQSCLELLIRR